MQRIMSHQNRTGDAVGVVGCLIAPGARRPWLACEMLLPAISQACRMLNPLVMMRNPVMFVTEVGAAFDHCGHCPSCAHRRR